MKDILETQLRMFADPMAIVVITRRQARWSDKKFQAEHTKAVKAAIIGKRLDQVEWRRQDDLAAIMKRKWKDPEWAEPGSWAVGQGARNKAKALAEHHSRFERAEKVEGRLPDPAYFHHTSPEDARKGFPKVSYTRDPAAAGKALAAKYEDVTFEEVPDRGVQ